MQSIQGDQAHFLLHDVCLPAIKNEYRITRGVIEAIPADKGDYRPDPVSKSAMELAWHITVTEMRFMEAVASGAFDLSPRPRPESVKTPSDLLSWYEENFQTHFAVLANLTNDQLTRTVDFRGMFQLPAVSYLNFVLHHSVHHRGQLSMYLRPMGAKVPAIYGESYDSAEARKAAKG
jgi:uncharacterized damage-inducible protein DinB